MQRLFFILFAFCSPPAFTLTIAILLEGVFGFGEWIYWVLGVAGALITVPTVIVVWKGDADSKPPLTLRDLMFLGLALAVIGSAAVFLASYDHAWSRVMRGFSWDGWQKAHGRIVGGAVTTYYTENKYSALNRHSTSFDYEFEVEGVKFNGSDSDSGQGELGTGIYVWYNPRDPVQNLGRMKDQSDPFPSAGVWHIFYLIALASSIGGTASMALGLACPVRIGWWLPPATAALITVAVWGGNRLGEERAESRAWFMSRPAFGDDRPLADLWRNSYVPGAPNWRGRNAIQWVTALTRKQPKERADALRELADIKPSELDALPVLFAVLQYGNVADEAVAALVRIGPRGADAMIELLKASGTHPFVVDGITRALGQIPECASKSAPLLVGLASGKGEGIRQLAYESLGQLAKTDDTALRLLIGQIDTDPGWPWYLVKALAQVGPRAAAAEPGLLKLMQRYGSDGQLELVAHVTDAIQAVSGRLPPSIPSWRGKPLTRWQHELSAAGRSVQESEAAAAMLSVGPNDKDAIPLLIALIRTQRTWASGTHRFKTPIEGQWAISSLEVPVHALVRIGDASVPAVMELLKEGAAEVRWPCLSVLRRLPGQADLTLPLFEAELSSAIPEMRGTAIMTIASFARHHDASLRLLIAQLKHQDPIVVMAAVQAVQAIGPRAKDAVPLLIHLEQKYVKEPVELNRIRQALKSVRGDLH